MTLRIRVTSLEAEVEGVGVADIGAMISALVGAPLSPAPPPEPKAAIADRPAPLALPKAIPPTPPVPAKSKPGRKPKAKSPTEPTPPKTPRRLPDDHLPDDGERPCVNQTKDEESVTFRGRTMELQARQAELVAVLLPAFGNAIDRQTIIRKIWGASAPQSADTMLGQLAKDTHRAIESIGLSVTTLVGVGIVLGVSA